MIRDNPLIVNLFWAVKNVFRERMAIFGLFWFVTVIIIAIFAPFIAPYESDEMVIEGEELLINKSPSTEHLLGTNTLGQDLFSRLIYGFRRTLTVGLTGGLIMVGIGSSIGLISGYKGGLIDEGLMRFTDIIYGMPVIPFAVVIVAVFGIKVWSTILAIALILWRTQARVIRSQVLSIREREYILAARSLGASSSSIIGVHILPSVFGMIVLYFALSFGWSVLWGASLAFLGLGDPTAAGWGIMLNRVWKNALIPIRPLWALLPAIMISLTVLSCFLIGRASELGIAGRRRGG